MSNRLLRAEIWTNNSDGEPGQLVATSRDAKDEGTLSSSYRWIDFSFDSDFVLEEDQVYHLVLSASDTIEIESSVSFDGYVTYTSNDYEEEVDLNADENTTIAHGIGSRDVIVTFYDSENQISDLEHVKVLDSNLVQVRSGSDVSGTVVVRKADFAKDLSLVGGGAETFRHDLNADGIIAQVRDANDEYVNISRIEHVSQNNVEVENALDFEGRLMIARSVDRESISVEADVVERIEQFGDSAFLPMQVWDSNNELITVGRLEIVPSDDVVGSVWQADPDSGEFDRVLKSSDGNNWSEDSTVSPNARIYTEDIPVVLETRKIDLKQPGARKQVRKIMTDFNLEGATFFVDVITDGKVVDTMEIEGENTGAVWNDFFWNEGYWGGVEDTFADPSVVSEAIGRTFKLRIRSTQARGFQLFSLSSLVYVRNPR